MADSSCEPAPPEWGAGWEHHGIAVTRVLAVTNWFPPHHTGGYELSCLDVMRRLRDRGHDITVLCSDERRAGVPDSAEPIEGHVHRDLRLYFRDGEPVRPPLRERLAVERHNQSVLRRVLDRTRPDVVSAWHFGALSLGLLTTVAEADIPIVYAVCDDWLTYAHRLDPWLGTFHDRVGGHLLGRAVRPLVGVPTSPPDLGETGAFLFVSESTRRRSKAASAWTFPRSTVTYSGIERAAFPGQGEVPAGLDRPWRSRLLHVGRFDARKGTETLLRALPLLPEASCAFYGQGGGAERLRLEALASALGVADRVRFGAMERHELAGAYVDADVFVFPSEWEEPFGLVPLEAMACGTPVIATGTGGSGEFLRHGANCVRFRPGDAEDLAEAVTALAGHPDLRAHLVAGGYRTADDFDVDRLADVFEAWHAAAAERFLAGEPPARRTVVGELPMADVGRTVAGNIPTPMFIDPLGRHIAAADEAVASGDAASIKRLYLDLGADWWESHRDDLGSVPVLSAPETHPAVVGRLGGRSGLTLDAGCGPNPAVAISLAAEPARTVVALDIGWGTVRIARAVAAARDAPLLGVVGDVEHLPFRDGAFEAVVSDDTIEHLPDDRRGVVELARVTRPGAPLVLATPNRHDAFILRRRLADRLRGRRRPLEHYFVSNSHLREYTWGEFERLVSPVAQIRGRVGVGWEARAGSWKSRLLSRLVRRRPFHHVSQMIVVEARR